MSGENKVRSVRRPFQRRCVKWEKGRPGLHRGQEEPIQPDRALWVRKSSITSDTQYEHGEHTSWYVRCQSQTGEMNFAPSSLKSGQAKIVTGKEASTSLRILIYY